jgi:type I restriction enzyme S subunit
MTIAAKRVVRLIADMAGGERESLTFAVLRDTLLPRLISGNLRVSEAGRFMEATRT